MDKKFLKKIIAQSPEDLQIISACCAEAKVKISEIKYLPSSKIFLISLLRLNKENENNKSSIKSIIECSNKNEVPVYVDPKFDNYSSYKGVRLFKPNLVEYKAITKEEEFGPLPKSGFRFKDRMNSEILLLTLGSSGMSLYFDGIHESIPTKARDVYDVSGAGDTVIATFALNDLCGLKPLESAIIANLAAGRVCEDIGVCPITIDSLIDFFSHHYSLDY